jgi:uncharacterized protein
MTEAKAKLQEGTAVLGLLLALGLVVGGWALGAQIKAMKLGDRYVEVRGLAERDVKSDVATWPIDYKEAADDLPSLYSKTEADKKTILQFLEQQGIQPSEIGLGIIRVVDNQAKEDGNGNRAPHRYIAEQEVFVQTSRVDQVAAAAQKTMILLQEGIVLDSGSNQQGVIFRFTGLNAIKPDMITEATRNAHVAADRFALDSGSKVGSIRNANQGVFAILPANSGGDLGGADDSAGYSSNADSSLMKTVRVVTSVQYYLEK